MCLERLEKVMVNMMCDFNLLCCDYYFVAVSIYLPTLPQQLCNCKVAVNFACSVKLFLMDIFVLNGHLFANGSCREVLI